MISRAPTSNADMSRTIAMLLDIDVNSINARVLREALSGIRHKAVPAAKRETLTSVAAVDGLVTELQ